MTSQDYINDIPVDTRLICKSCKDEVEFCQNHNKPHHADLDKFYDHFVSEVVEVCKCGRHVD